MIKRIVKAGNDAQYNFNTSKDISCWSAKYDSSIDDIQKIFNDCGNSITKTIEILNKRNEHAGSQIEPAYRFLPC